MPASPSTPASTAIGWPAMPGSSAVAAALANSICPAPSSSSTSSESESSRGYQAASGSRVSGRIGPLNATGPMPSSRYSS
jgi:hypothetical protein